MFNLLFVQLKRILVNIIALKHFNFKSKKGSIDSRLIDILEIGNVFNNM